MSKSRTSFRRRLLRAGIATAATTAAVTAITAPAYATSVALTLSTSSASVGAVLSPGVSVVASSATAWLPSTGTQKVLFTTATSCGNNYPSSVASPNTDAGSLTKYSAYRGSFVVPTALQPLTTTTYRVCVYTGATTSDTLIGNTTFTIFANPDFTGPETISVNTGPTSGGTLVTVTGAAGLPTTAAGYTSVMVGGTAATTVTPISATSFSFVTPPHAAGAATIAVNLASGGAANLTHNFTYYNAISVTPNSGLYDTDTPIDITGGGFNALTLSSGAFGAVNTAFAHVFLTQGAYNNAGTISTGPYTTATSPVSDCTASTTIKLSDSEIICTLNLHLAMTPASPYTAQGSSVTKGAYTVSVVNDARIATGTPAASLVTPSATFTVTDYPTTP